LQGFFFHWSYSDYVDCDVVHVEACSFLLDRPWEFDNDVIYHGRSNTYTFMHKGKNTMVTTLRPLYLAAATLVRFWVLLRLFCKE